MIRPGISSRISPGRKIGWLAISAWSIVPSDAAVALPTRLLPRPGAFTRPMTASPVGHGAGVAVTRDAGDADGHGDGTGEGDGDAAITTAANSTNNEAPPGAPRCIHRRASPRSIRST